eukprot:2014209-Rhodomonas_salina.1
MLCGKQFFNLDLMQNVDDLWRAHGLLCLDLASFGAQIKTAAQEHHCNIFVGNDHWISKHQLRELIKWKLLELSFDPFKDLSANTHWATLQALVAQDHNLNADEITPHFAAISVLRSQIMVSSTSTTNESIKERVVGILIDKLQEAY